MIDRESWRSCAPRYDTTDRAVNIYAAEQGVHPSLIAGLLRKESGNYRRYSSIINEHDVREIIFQP
jgi:HTH-type transcriptional regulator/antitoxin HigA